MLILGLIPGHCPVGGNVSRSSTGRMGVLLRSLDVTHASQWHLLGPRTVSSLDRMSHVVQHLLLTYVAEEGSTKAGGRQSQTGRTDLDCLELVRVVELEPFQGEERNLTADKYQHQE